MGCRCGKEREKEKKEEGIIYNTGIIRWEDTIFYKMRRAKNG